MDTPPKMQMLQDAVQLGLRVNRVRLLATIEKLRLLGAIVFLPAQQRMELCIIIVWRINDAEEGTNYFMFFDAMYPNIRLVTGEEF
jgi:hypothetical protein